VTAEIIAGRGDNLPVSAFPVDGTYPVATAQWEKRNIAQEVPVWEPDICIECGKCMLVCPHSTIRAKVVKQEDLANAPAGFKTMPAKWRELSDYRYTIQVAVEDCTGCQLCVEVCPAKDKSNVSRKALNMAPQLPLRDNERVNWDYFLTLPEVNRNNGLTFRSVKDVQLLQPLFEFSGACSGCGETPYIKLLTQLFGDRAIIANATDARASTAAICQRRLTQPIRKVAARPGATRCLKTTPNSVWACVCRSTISKRTRNSWLRNIAK
jgi:pyruvate-ferredoxin/flavodoxin oxidoreductase